MANSGFGQMGAQNFGTVATITPSDSAANAYDAIYVGVSGDVSIVPADSSATVLFKAAPVGILRVRTSKVMSTSTTATTMLGLTA